MAETDNIQLYIRLRPLNVKESNSKVPVLWTRENNNVAGTAGEKMAYDHVFDKDCKNMNVFDKLKPLIDSYVQGYNATIFAYGQTGSGKTHTITGTSAEVGLTKLAMDKIFDYIEENEDKQFAVRVSYLEIYNETLVDLLRKDGGKDNLRIRVSEDGNTYIPGLTEVVVNSVEHILEMKHDGDVRRRVAETLANDRSSRSHTIFTVWLESRMMDRDIICTSQLHLVDLAGSERVDDTGAQGSTLRESCHINKSLSNLCHVINSLSEGAKFVNYRDSKLTRYLQNSLGGNAKTCIICTISIVNSAQTLSTLRFASAAKCVKTAAKVNEVKASEEVIKELQEHINQLKGQISVDNSAQMQSMRDQLHLMEKNYNNLLMITKFGEVLTPRRKNASPKRGRRYTWAPQLQQDTGRTRLSFSSFAARDFGEVAAKEESCLLENEAFAPISVAEMSDFVEDEEMVMLKQELTDAREKQSEIHNLLIAKETEVMELQMKVGGLSCDIETLTEKEAKLKEEVVRLRESAHEEEPTVYNIKELESNVDVLSVESRAAQAESKVNILEEQILQLQKKFEDQEFHYMEQLANQTECLTPAPCECGSKIEDLEKQLRVVEMRSTAEFEEMILVKSSLKKMQQDKEQAIAALESLKENSVESEEMVQLKERLEKMQQDKEQAEAALESLKENSVESEEMVQLKERLEMMQQDKEQAIAALESLKENSVESEEMVQLKERLEKMQQDKEQAEAALKRLNDEKDSMKNEAKELLEKLEAVVAGRMSDRKQYANATRKLMQANAEHLKRLEKIQQDKEQVESALENLRGEHSVESSTEVSQLKQRLSKMQEDKKQAEAALASLKEKKYSMENEAEEFREKLEAVVAGRMSDRKQYANATRKLMQAKAQLESNLDDLQHKILLLSGENRTMENELEKCQQHLKELKASESDYSVIHAKNKALERQLDMCHHEIVELKELNTNKEEELEKIVEDRMSIAVEENQDLKIKMEICCQQMKELKDLNTKKERELEKVVEGKKSDRKQFTVATKNLVKMKEAAEENLRQLQDKLSQLDSKKPEPPCVEDAFGIANKAILSYICQLLSRTEFSLVNCTDSSSRTDLQWRLGCLRELQDYLSVCVEPAKFVQWIVRLNHDKCESASKVEEVRQEMNEVRRHSTRSAYELCLQEENCDLRKRVLEAERKLRSQAHSETEDTFAVFKPDRQDQFLKTRNDCSSSSQPTPAPQQNCSPAQSSGDPVKENNEVVPPPVMATPSPVQETEEDDVTCSQQ